MYDRFFVRKMLRPVRTASVLLMAATLTGCLGTAVGAAVDVSLEVAKVPFKVAGAVADVATGDDDEDKDKD